MKVRQRGVSRMAREIEREVFADRQVAAWRWRNSADCGTNGRSSERCWRIDDQRMAVTIVLNDKIRQLIVSIEFNTVKRLTAVVVQRQRPGIVTLRRVSGLAHRYGGNADI